MKTINSFKIIRNLYNPEGNRRGLGVETTKNRPLTRLSRINFISEKEK